MPRPEELNRTAHRLLADWNLNMSPSRVTRVCRDYLRTSGQMPFEHYLLNNADVSEMQRVGLRNLQGVVDPTGQQAATNVDRQRVGR